MARFDVYSNPSSQADITPYLLDVQSNLLDDLESRMVIPFRSLKHFPKVKLSAHLTPIFTIRGQEYLMETPKMGAAGANFEKARDLTCKGAGKDYGSPGFPVSRLLNIQQNIAR